MTKRSCVDCIHSAVAYEGVCTLHWTNEILDIAEDCPDYEERED